MKVLLISLILCLCSGCSSLTFKFEDKSNSCSSQSAGQWCDYNGVKAKTLRGE